MIRFEENAMNAFQTHGAFSWNELMTSDPAASAHFYKQLLGWTLESSDMPGIGIYRVVKVEGEKVAGIMGMPSQSGPMPPAWGAYITVDNTDETAGECAALGGKVLVPPTDIPGVGRFAVLQDPQGAVFNVIDYFDE
jgi:predicted enzyme related to lactoylglutathione lyase